MRAVSLPFVLAPFVLSVVLGACSKSPAEPDPVARTSSASTGVAPATTTASAKPKACIDPLPEVAPPTPSPAGDKCPVDPEMGGPKLPVVEVTFPEAPSAPKVAAELASKAREVERGLMFRKAMGDDRGMLFRLSERKVQTFWMQNTCISLDMMFIDDDGTIVGISEAARPLDEAIRSVACPSAWVLEVNAGWSRKYGIKPGQKMTIPASAR
jgi:uncharacterized membrane protein (UPF0127 family)